MTTTVDRPAQARKTAKAKAKLSTETKAERRFAYLLIAPAILVMIAVTAYPVGYAIYLSLQRYDLRFPAAHTFIGVSNYTTVLTSSLFGKAVIVTLIITVVSVLIEFVLGMFLALIMQRATFGKSLVRTSILVPYGMVTVVAALSWQFAWTPKTGYLIHYLQDLHILNANSAPLTHTYQAIAIIILAEVWKTTPFMALLLLAGLALVPGDLLNAAKVDGATAWQRFVRITLPLMKPAILVALLFRTLDAFRVFDNIFVLTSGGTHDTRSVSILNYDQLFTALNLGVGSAMSVVIFLITALIAFAFVKGFGAAAPGSSLEK